MQKWQWFIEVEPSPELVKYLRDDNTFSLIPSASPKPLDNAPSWFFIANNTTTLQSPQGSLRLIFNDKTHMLYATDSGSGFRPGAPEPLKAAPAQTPLKRLPK